MILSSMPIRLVDLIGSILMIVFSFLSLHIAVNLKKREPNNLIWAFLFWFCLVLTVFAVSRSVGHIIKQVLIISGYDDVWNRLRPVSGSVNTFTLTIVASITLFFERTWKMYRQILVDKQEIATAHEKLVFLNQNLERMVKERTQELAASETKYRRVFEVSKDMILMIRPDGSILDMNPEGYKMLEIDYENRGEKGRNFLHYLADSGDLETIVKTVFENGFISSVEFDLKRDNGVTFPALISAGIDYGAKDTSPELIHILVKDIEKRRLMEQQMAHTDKLVSIGQLSAGVAHEINNPLSIILGYTQLLLRDEDPENQRYGDLKIIEKHVRNCKTIVEDLLNFSRSSETRKEIVRIHDLIDEVITVFHHRKGSERIEIDRNYDFNAPEMYCDEKQIKQVMINLLMNAEHAVGKQGKIGITSRYDDLKENISICVKDNGYGIEKGIQNRIFDPFFTTKPTGEGTGLGLSVSYGIVKNHGGDIHVKSKSGEGAEFTVLLPAKSSDEKSLSSA